MKMGTMQKCGRMMAMTGLLLGSAVLPSEAIEYNIQGEWLWGFGGVESTLIQNNNDHKDVFDARQRLRLQLEAIASESLSGTVRLEIGDIAWGKAEDGGALGTDGSIVGVKNAFLDWTVPQSTLRLRMGLQSVALPNVAGGSPILDDEVAGIVASWQFTDAVGLTAFWLRPFNDNYTGEASGDQASLQASTRSGAGPAGFLDNVDYVGLSLPLKFNGVELTPWVMAGFAGRNALQEDGPNVYQTMPLSFSRGQVADYSLRDRNIAYGSQWYAGLPVSVKTFDPLLIELDINYGYSEGFGKYSVEDRKGVSRNAQSLREGWLVKALVEYSLDWGVPGILGWYASGDDDSVKNGSERMPAISPSANFTSFMQDGPLGWSLDGGYDKMLTFDGTWGLGLQLRDLSFVEDLSHTLRVVYWGGTNSPAMIKQTSSPQAWNNADGLYLTTQDHLVEVNVDSTYKIYENLEAMVELGYIFNGMDRDAWRKHAADKSYQNADAWKAALIVKYEF